MGAKFQQTTAMGNTMMGRWESREPEAGRLALLNVLAKGDENGIRALESTLFHLFGVFSIHPTRKKGSSRSCIV